MKKKDELRDIYQSESHDLEKDFTPQRSEEAARLRQRDLQRTRFITFFFGGLALAVILVIIVLVFRDALDTNEIAQKITPKDTTFIPRHSLPSEATWVMDYQRVADQMDPQDDLEEKPLSTKWVKKAAYYIIMGQQALAIKELDSALENFRKVVEIYPEIEGIHRSLGMLYVEREEYEKAAEHLEIALQEEELFDVANNLGTAYIGTQDYEKAEKHLLRALEIQPENPISHKNLAALYRKMEREESAVFHFEKYIDLRPNDLDTLQSYALYLTKIARWEQAAEFLTELTQEVTDVAPLYFLLAQVQVQNNKEQLAMAALQRGIQLIDPSLAMAWMSSKEFNDVRGSSEFKSLVDELEIASVSLDDVQ